MKKLEYVCPEIESVKLYSEDEINTFMGVGGSPNVEGGTTDKPGTWN